MLPRFWVLSLLIIAVSIILAGCQADDPKDRSIRLDIQNGKLSDSTSFLVVNQDDTVSLLITSDETIKLHLHGYDLERTIAPGSTENLKFEATATGSFPITMHTISDYENGGSHGHGEQMHGDLFESPLLEPGDSFLYQVKPHSMDQTIHYHSHLHPELEGSIIVSSYSSSVAKIDISISDKSVRPPEVTVKPGTEINWINKDIVPHIIVSGPHPESSIETESTKSEHREGEPGHNQHEIELGRLEIHP
ncbi:hypothetical protein FIM12_07015 [SAR202 cluster bacterium AD-804-J14_MRT_500m]|nr:hypothetical protein [SAR202 cluster bacterium AD-804-J14_MRT_500m]